MMNRAATAWTAGEQRKNALMNRCEKYASFTLPHIHTPVGYNEQTGELKTDWQALGAQAVNNLANKLMLALFAPSRPFFRLDLPPGVAEGLGMPQEKLQGLMSQSEQKALRRLENMAVRPKLYEAVKLLIVTGNALMILGKPGGTPMRVLGLKRYCVKRSMSGKVIQIVIHEELRFDELDSDVQQHLKATQEAKYAMCNPDDPQTCGAVKYYKLIQWDGVSRYRETVQIDDVELGAEYQSMYTEETLPYHALTWELCDDNDYGTGLVEQFSGDFAALSALSEAQIQAAILASEFRWLVNPGGQTNPVDLENSANGAALPGVKDDIIPLVTGTGQTLQYLEAVANQYVNRIGRGFLLGSSVIRDAERVTAEEVRLQAQELETSLGGVYSRLAVDWQMPISFWLIRITGVEIAGTAIQPTIITGLDALSRNSDLEALKMCLQDIAIISGAPPQVLAVLRLDAVIAAIFAGRGVNAAAYVKTPEEQAADMANDQQAMLAQQVARPVAAAVAGGGAPA